MLKYLAITFEQFVSVLTLRFGNWQRIVSASTKLYQCFKSRRQYVEKMITRCFHSPAVRFDRDVYVDILDDRPRSYGMLRPLARWLIDSNFFSSKRPIVNSSETIKQSGQRSKVRGVFDWQNPKHQISFFFFKMKTRLTICYRPMCCRYCRPRSKLFFTRKRFWPENLFGPKTFWPKKLKILLDVMI